VHPLGARRSGDGWSFAVWSSRATAVTLVVADRLAPASALVERAMRREGDVWVAEVSTAEIGDADLYGLRADGPWAPLRGDRFDVSKLLLDPHAFAVWFPPDLDRDAARVRGVDTIGRAPWGVLVESRPRRAVERPQIDTLVIAEVHVGSYTRSPSSGVRSPGTFAGMIERLDHLAELGITAVEVMPVHAVDPAEGSVWGYMPLSYMAIDPRFAAGDDPAAELADLCSACHERGMELWVDVVFNHTTEEDHAGPTYSFRGLDARAYYALTEVGGYIDDAGCGNVLAASHSVVADLVAASLERLADLGVDGFRFDLATVLCRDDDSLVRRITDIAERRGVRLVAEPWDVVRHQVGPAFAGPEWMQWNDHFRDTVRSFVKGDPGRIDALREVVQGCPHLFPASPALSVDFVSAHDGFTMRDLVSYQHKRNEVNGHANTDGTDDNRSWNCGWEGDEGAPREVQTLRDRQVRNFFTVLLCSAGTPMLLAGDEMGRTQRGNNNAYRSDDESIWLDWSGLETSADMVRFVRGLIALRRRHRVLAPATHWGEQVSFVTAGSGHDLGWCVRAVGEADGSGGDTGGDVVVLANAHWSEQAMPVPAGRWSRVVDTSRASPDDIVDTPVPLDLVGDHLTVGARAVVVLVSSP
jgi:isoamylase